MPTYIELRFEDYMNERGAATWTKRIPEGMDRFTNERPQAKKDINELLFQILPDTATVKELDIMATEIFKAVAEVWERREKDRE